MTTKQRLLNIFETLLLAFGKRNWWPGETELEVIVGAILTQNTSWRNVEKAIANLKANDLLDFDALLSIDNYELGGIIKSSGFYNQKTKKIKSFLQVIHNLFNGSMYYIRNYDTSFLRKLMLGINGIGPETADSILLYALNRPVFVVDSYTKRFLYNHKLYDGSWKYDDVQNFFMANLPRDTYLFNEFHALIVCLCQTYCKKLPECLSCPLNNEYQRE